MERCREHRNDHFDIFSTKSIVLYLVATSKNNVDNPI